MKRSYRHSLSRRPDGSALVLVIVLIALVMGGTVSYLLLSSSQARKGVKIGVQMSGGSKLENQMATLHGNARVQMESGATVDLGSWAQSVTQQAFTASDPYTVSAVFANNQNQVNASQSSDGFGDYPSGQLTQSDDPFRGARADVMSTSLVAKATRTKANPYAAGAGQSDAPLNVVYNATVDWRRMPVSQWTYYSQGGATLSAGEFPNGNAGRAYVAKDAGISGGISTTYPFAAGGNIFLDTSKSSSSLTARSSPTDTESFTLQSDTTEPTWPEYARSIAKSKVLSGRDMPLGVMRPGSASDLTSSPEVDLGSDARNAQKLCLQCERFVHVYFLASSSGIKGGGGAVIFSPPQIEVRDAQGNLYPDEKAAFSFYSSPNHEEITMIDFDYTAQTAIHRSYYFYVDSPDASSPYAGNQYAVMIQHARVLQAPLSIVAPLDIYVENGIGDLNADGSAVTVPTVAASLTTGNHRVFGIKTGW